MDKKDTLIKQTALSLFSQYGWVKVSIDMVCQRANVSRVTFYKYFPNKKALLKNLLIENKDQTYQLFLGLLQGESNLEQVVETIFSIQREAFQGLYSQPMMFDFTHHKDEELDQFFTEMEQEKYEFMHHFFGQLQQKRVINPQMPILLIDLFIRQIDKMKKSPALLQHYEHNEHQMLKDLLHLLMHGIADKPTD